MNKEKIYETATQMWGHQAQLLQAVEELSELTKAIIKHLNRGENPTPILEETADVEIMCEQIRHIFSADGFIDREKNRKLERLALKLGLEAV